MNGECSYIFDVEWFENTALKNPICTSDHTLEEYFPEFYSLHYDVRVLATKSSTTEEKLSPFYNDYREQYGVRVLSEFDKVFGDKPKKYVFLNGFTQTQFAQIVPKIKDTAEVIYFFKCPKIKDLSALSQFRKLKCVFIFWNNTLESLWEMKDNTKLQVISFESVTKLKNIDTLKDSSVEYVNFDSFNNSGNGQKILFDPKILEEMKTLKHLSLKYTDLFINR